MRSDSLPSSTLQRLSELITQTAGLDFPPERYGDLQRGLDSAAVELGFTDTPACIDWLLGAAGDDSRVHAVVAHLAIGDTYFFRERRMFDALASHVLPELLSRGTRRLRIWSAACSTGEEPYSLAILLREVLPQWRHWDITLLATDINERSLQKAAAGVYGEWSFRDATPGLKERYFRRTPQGRFVIAEEIRNMVHFTRFNLAQERWPALVSGDNAMDLILCRNVLMYFSMARARRAVENLATSLADHGWLVVSPSEYSQTTFARFASVHFPDCILYRKQVTAAQTAPQAIDHTERLPAPEGRQQRTPASDRLPLDAGQLDIASSRSTQPDAATQSDGDGTTVATRPTPEHHALLTRTLANQGQLEQALESAARWIAADKTNPSAHYLQATVHQELGHLEAARHALQRAIYLKPDFVVAHFALGNLARATAGGAAATRHFNNALALVKRFPAQEPLLESAGTTAAYLEQVINTLLATAAQRSELATGTRE